MSAGVFGLWMSKQAGRADRMPLYIANDGLWMLQYCMVLIYRLLNISTLVVKQFDSPSIQLCISTPNKHFSPQTLP